MLKELRAMLLDLGFAEAIKWGRPMFMLAGKNLVGLGAFKHHFSLWFMKGHLLSDPLNVLSNAQPGKTKEMRHWKWEDLEAVELEEVRKYLEEVRVIHLNQD
jgi:uncharacterized protein YdeI (YjbR/CyaY-like superfamily)